VAKEYKLIVYVHPNIVLELNFTATILPDILLAYRLCHSLACYEHFLQKKPM